MSWSGKDLGGEEGSSRYGGCMAFWPCELTWFVYSLVYHARAAPVRCHVTGSKAQRSKKRSLTSVPEVQQTGLHLAQCTIYSHDQLSVSFTSIVMRRQHLFHLASQKVVLSTAYLTPLCTPAHRVQCMPWGCVWGGRGGSACLLRWSVQFLWVQADSGS